MLRGIGAVILACGCFQPKPALDVPCAENGACPDGQHCDTGQSPPRCVFVDVDAATGGSDGASIDAPPDIALHGTLDVALEPLGTVDINLTSEGKLDWAHWGLLDVASFDHKLGGSGLVDETVVGTDTRKQGTQVALTSSWTDGTPDATATASATALSFLAPTGVELAIPASKTMRTLRLYVGVKFATARLDLAMSDNSAGTFTQTQTSQDATALHFRYTIKFAAGSDNQTLSITWTETTQLGNGGLVELISATLQ